MKKQTLLITGASGEIGHGLINEYAKRGAFIVAADLKDPDESLLPSIDYFKKGDVSDPEALKVLFRKFDFDVVFHLASMLSTSGERDPVKSHHVNTDGAIYALKYAEEHSRAQEKRVKFIFPSSIAVYGMPDLPTKAKAGKVNEDQFLTPGTSYGCNKIYIELLGNYFSKYFQKYPKYGTAGYLDFRVIRFPGIISADTIPSGGTSDFGPEMLHAAAQGKPYECFVRADTQIPFMVMPDAIDALTKLTNAPRAKLSRHVYNVNSFSVTAAEIAEIAKKAFPGFKISYKPDQKRQSIVDSWPTDIDDSAARKDWGFAPVFDKKDSFEKYLLPTITRRYKQK